MFDLLNIFLAKESSILNFLYRLIDFFWCYFNHILVHIWLTEHIYDKRVLTLGLSVPRLLLMFHPIDGSPNLANWTYFWPKSPGNSTFYAYSLNSFDVTKNLTVFQILSFWTYFWGKSPRSWTFYTCSLTCSDVSSSRQYFKFDFWNIILYKESSKWNLPYIS